MVCPQFVKTRGASESDSDVTNQGERQKPSYYNHTITAAKADGKIRRDRQSIRRYNFPSVRRYRTGRKTFGKSEKSVLQAEAKRNECQHRDAVLRGIAKSTDYVKKFTNNPRKATHRVSFLAIEDRVSPVHDEVDHGFVTASLAHQIDENNKESSAKS